VAAAVQPVRRAPQLVKGSIVTIKRQGPPPPIPARSAARSERYSLPALAEPASPAIRAVARGVRSESVSEGAAAAATRVGGELGALRVRAVTVGASDKAEKEYAPATSPIEPAAPAAAELAAAVDDDEADDADDGTIYSKHTSSIFTAAQGNRWSMAPTEDVSMLDDDGAASIGGSDKAAGV
jgi:hypothetical protein